MAVEGVGLSLPTAPKAPAGGMFEGLPWTGSRGDGLGSIINGIGSLFSGGDGASLFSGDGGGGGGFFDGIGDSLLQSGISKAVTSFLPELGIPGIGEIFSGIGADG